MESSEPSTSSKDNLNQPLSSGESDANPMDVTAGQSVDEFLSTGRTGRRNALPDILEKKSTHVNTSDLPNELEKLNFGDSTQHNGSSGSSSGSETASCNQQNK